MRRHVTKEDTYRLIEKFRKKCREFICVLRLWWGIQEKTEADFEELLSLSARCASIEWGICVFREEEGTRAAAHYEDSIPQEVKQARLDELMSIQQGISAELSAADRHRQMKVKSTVWEGDYYIGRMESGFSWRPREVLIEW